MVCGNPSCSGKLINIIEKYNLDQYDYADYDGGIIAEPEEVAQEVHHKEILKEEPIPVEKMGEAEKQRELLYNKYEVISD